MPKRSPTGSGVTRRCFLREASGSFGGVALTRLEASRGSDSSPSPGDASYRVGSAGTAKRVILLFMSGGVSHVDTFDYKPTLVRLHGQLVPDSLRESKAGAASAGPGRIGNARLLAGPWQWSRRGQSGLWMSDLLPCLGELADELCVIHSLQNISVRHADATRELFSGSAWRGELRLGSMIAQNLGVSNPDMPAFVELSRNGGGPSGTADRSFDQRGRLPLKTGTSSVAGEKSLRRPDSQLPIRVPSAPCDQDRRGKRARRQAADFSDESRATLSRYGISECDSNMEGYGRMCLAARRLLEAGVCVVQIDSAADKIGWDGHSDLVGNHRKCARQVDQPVAALLQDLKQRGMLQETLVVWLSEFGRTPTAQNGNGRDHNPGGFSVWLAGGGVTGGRCIGATDEIGLEATLDRWSVADLHANIASATGVTARRVSRPVA